MVISKTVKQPLPALYRRAFHYLHQFFEYQCDIAPEATALIHEQAPISYAELDERANQLANYLLRRGIRVGDRIGILLHRSVETYIALLAVLKSGAAFVPMDAAFPPERIAFMAEDAALSLIITTTEFSQAISDCAVLTPDILTLDTQVDNIAAYSTSRIAIAYREDHLCYIIYTSGSTGRPKGVAVNHSSICNFIAVCTPIYGITAQDRVYQGMTIAFDFSIEEIWTTFSVGATLIVGPTDHRRLGVGLAAFLRQQRVTALCCVPTLLATLDSDIPSLRTLIVGGEACPHHLVQRWSLPNRRMLNTYGPTETTVTALWTELVPDQPVTIGKPLPTYSVYLLDEELHPVPTGEPGEICIGGVGVAVGYVNRSDLTVKKFIPNQFLAEAQERLYRTGDLGRLMPNGEIEYLGRIDDQVKIRGYRVELSEIEAVILEHPEIETATVSLLGKDADVQELTAYITLRHPADSDSLRQEIYTSLRKRLPSYMVPVYIEILDQLPTLASGKIDRSKLPAPKSLRLNCAAERYVSPATRLEERLSESWCEVFGISQVSVEADFFYDLGGHSLLAANLISKLRQHPGWHFLSIADIYACPTIRLQANQIERLLECHQAPAQPQDLPSPKRYSNAQVAFCGAFQLAWIYALLAILASPLSWLLSVTPSELFSGFGLQRLLLISTSWILMTILLPVVAKWLLIGQFRPGRYPLWGWYYCRWWLVRKLLGLSPLVHLPGSPLMPIYLRLLGAKIGKGCLIATSHIQLPDLITLEDKVSVGYGVDIHPFEIKDGWLTLAPIHIGANAYVGTNAVIMLGSQIQENARVADQSLVAANQQIPTGQTWAGSPSRRAAPDPVLEKMAALKSPRSSWSISLWIGFIAGFILLEHLPFLLFLPGLGLIYAASRINLFWSVIAVPVAGLLFVLLTCASVAIGKKLAIPKAKPGIFYLHSSFGLRKWIADRLMVLSLAATNTLYATLYTIPWLRLLGAKIGPRSEVSTVSHLDPDLLVLGAEAFVADFVAIGPAKHYNGLIALGPTQIGNRSFAGNASLIPSETRISENCLIGVQSVPSSQRVKPGTSWLGSPAIFLPRRQPSACFDDSVTFRPPVRLVAYRLGVEFVRVVLPPTLLYTLVVQDILQVLWLAPRIAPWILIGIMPLLYLSSALIVTGIIAGLKWLLIGRYRPRVKPLWSSFVWRSELITGLYETVTVPLLLAWMTGTPFMAPLLRLFGARIGRRVWLETTYLTEFDLVHVADDAAVDSMASLQTHLFEDRVMKMSVVKVGAGCSIGVRSIVLYDSVMEMGSKLDAMSLLMKGETLPFQTTWRGIPAQSAAMETKQIQP